MKDKKNKEIPKFKKGSFVSKPFRIPFDEGQIIPEGMDEKYDKLLMNGDGLLESLTDEEIKELVKKITKSLWEL